MAKKVNGIRTFKPQNRLAWRKWLIINHTSTEPVFLIVFHKKSKSPNISYDEAVEEALCFGWIDNKRMNRDDQSSYLQFCRRKEKSNWSKLNRERAERMMRDGLMTDAGMVLIDAAKKDRRWG